MGRLARIALLLFGSGFCALIYQTAWMRMFRLLFGASTAATSATLAVFMGGLGLGGYLLARRVERHERPLELYAHLELAVSFWVILSIGVLEAVTSLYHATGGSQVLGAVGATALRLLLSVGVMGPAVFLMGATLPAASRAVTQASDKARTQVAILLGLNTLGAFLGVLATTFVFLEVLGTTSTLMAAALLNALLGLTARFLSRGPDGELSVLENQSSTEGPQTPGAPMGFVLFAAAVVGFAFMLMELVWYRMLGPILGGSTYTFGIVLATALFGLGLGGALYAFWPRARPASFTALAVTCALEAATLLLPFALGDRLALFAGFLRDLGVMGFPWLVLTWLLVTGVVVLPVALVAGFQFPLLIALLGHGRAELGRQVAWAYAANTLGSIVGAIAGGFGLLPLLGATLAWQLVGVLLGLVSLGALAIPYFKKVSLPVAPTVTATGLWILCGLFLLAEGPTAVWRHGGIGAGRAGVGNLDSSEELENWKRVTQRQLFWEKDGVESSVALVYSNGIAFLVNGKSDGSTRGDAGTQVMGGLLGAALHEGPRRSLVVGLGTGSTAGWLGRLPSMERVDVAEIEPAIVEVARRSQAVNADALNNPKVVVHYEDAREMLLTSKTTYDLIFSEPSNPYRAGIASLYTREFYEAAKAHLDEDGVFLQWLQGYEVDASTVRSVLLTLRSVFPHVDVWFTKKSDLVLRGSMKPPRMSVDALKARLSEEPFLSAMRVSWSTEGVEGFLSHFVADDLLIAGFHEQFPADINTDDVNFVEFAFARSVGQSRRFDVADLRVAAQAVQAHRPRWLSGEVDWSRVDAERARPPRDLKAFAETWQKNSIEPITLADRMRLALGLADLGDERALDVMKPLAEAFATERAAIETRLRMAQKRTPETAAALVTLIEGLRKGPWVSALVEPEDTLLQAVESIAGEKDVAQKVFAALEAPFSTHNFEDLRMQCRLAISDALKSLELCPKAYSAWEPYTPWSREFLERRLQCYQSTGDSRAAVALAEWNRFVASEPTDLREGLPVAPAGAATTQVH